MLRRISVVITRMGASLFTAASPVSNPTLPAPNLSLSDSEEERGKHRCRHECERANIRARLHTHTRTRTHARTHAHTDAYTPTQPHTHTPTHPRTQAGACTHAFKHTHAHARAHAQVHLCLHAHFSMIKHNLKVCMDTERGRGCGAEVRGGRKTRRSIMQTADAGGARAFQEQRPHHQDPATGRLTVLLASVLEPSGIEESLLIPAWSTPTVISCSIQ